MTKSRNRKNHKSLANRSNANKGGAAMAASRKPMKVAMPPSLRYEIPIGLARKDQELYSMPVAINGTPALTTTLLKPSKPGGFRIEGWQPLALFTGVLQVSALTTSASTNKSASVSVTPWWMGAFAKTQCSLYTHYKVHGLGFRAVPTGSTAAVGLYAMSYQSDAAQAAPTTVVDAQKLPCVAAMAAGFPGDMVCPAEQLSGFDDLFCHNYTSTALTSVQRQQFAGTFTLNATATPLGPFDIYVYVHFDIEFYNPCVEDNLWTKNLMTLARAIPEKEWQAMSESDLEGLEGYVRCNPLPNLNDPEEKVDIEWFLKDFSDTHMRVTTGRARRLPPREWSLVDDGNVDVSHRSSERDLDDGVPPTLLKLARLSGYVR